MVTKKDQVIIEESIHRLELQLKKEFELGQKTVVLHGEIPEWVRLLVEEAIPQMAAHTLIVAKAKWN